MVDLPRIRTAKELGNILSEIHKRKRPDFKYSVEKKYTSKNANELTKAVCAFFEAYGGFAYRVNNVGVYDEKTGKRRAGTTIKGIADVTACLWGRMIQVEVKIGRDKLSEHQVKFRDNIHDSGGVYFVAKSFQQFTTEFWEWYDGRRLLVQGTLFTVKDEAVIVPRITWTEIWNEILEDEGDKLGLSSIVRESKEQKQAALDAYKNDGLTQEVSKGISRFVAGMMEAVINKRKK